METGRRIDDCLSTREGHLYIEGLDTTDLVQRFGSPLFVYSEDQLRRNIRRFQTAFQRSWPEGPVKVMPAAKANWIPAVQRVVASEGCGCDVYSPGELAVALASGFPPEFISVNGFPKDADHIRRCIETGVRITIDSVEEVDAIEQISRSLQKTAFVRLRIKAPLHDTIQHSHFVGEGLLPTDVAALVYKNGMSFEDLAIIGPRLLGLEHVKMVGFHQHNGRHRPTTRYWREQMEAYARDIGRLCRVLGGYRPQEIDIGGGFAIPRDPFNAATHYSEPLQFAVLHLLSRCLHPFGSSVRYRVLARLVDVIVSHPNRVMAPTIEQYGETCGTSLARALRKEGIDPRGILLQLEPGRSMHGNAGIHLATVRCMKTLQNPIRWRTIAVDSTEFWFTGGRFEHHLHHYLFANKADAPVTGKADIVGRSCYGDRLLPTVPVPDVRIGDVLAFLDTGSYQEVSNSNFNAMPRPATVLVRGEEAHLIRRRETEAEVFQRDAIPPHLAAIPA